MHVFATLTVSPARRDCYRLVVLPGLTRPALLPDQSIMCHHAPDSLRMPDLVCPVHFTISGHKRTS